MNVEDIRRTVDQMSERMFREYGVLGFHCLPLPWEGVRIEVFLGDGRYSCDGTSMSSALENMLRLLDKSGVKTYAD